MDNPRYRVESEELVFVASIMRRRGEEFECLGWPARLMCGKPLAAANEGAKRVMAYYEQHKMSERLPVTPYSQEAGGIFLPAMQPVPTPKDQAKVGMPVYSAPYGAEFRTGNTGPGVVFVFLAWPDTGWEPENAAAKQIMAYARQHHRHSLLGPSGWNLYDDTVFLPELAAPSGVVDAPRPLATGDRRFNVGQVLKPPPARRRGAQPRVRAQTHRERG
jgi:hypothetical protein